MQVWVVKNGVFVLKTKPDRDLYAFMGLLTISGRRSRYVLLEIATPPALV